VDKAPAGLKGKRVSAYAKCEFGEMLEPRVGIRLFIYPSQQFDLSFIAQVGPMGIRFSIVSVLPT
jgi:hypothetical protein